MPYTKLVADSGSSTLSSGVKANARSLIVVKPSLSSNSVIVESEKAEIPMVFTDAGIVTLLMVVQPKNA